MNLLAHLFPKARSEVLRLLLGQPGRELHLRDLARLARLSPAALQKELANLTTSGLIISRRDGNRLYFRANTQHPVYPDLHGLVLKTTGIVSETQQALANVEGITAAFIFGSIAAGTDTAESDVDVMILGSVGLRKISTALRGLADTSGREINPHSLKAEEWRAKAAKGDAFIRRLIAEPKLWLKGVPDELANLG